MKYRSAFCGSSLILLLMSTFFQVMAFQPAGLTALSSSSLSDYPQVDAFVTSRMKELNIPGVAIGIVRGNQVLYLQGYGVADPTGRPITPQTPFMIGSLSKSMTALSVMQLAEQGKIDLDAPVTTYLPWFRLADPDFGAQITVRRLLIQTSGIPGNASGNYGDDTVSAETFVRGMSSLEIHPPDDPVFQYSDANYVTLGLLVEKASGQCYSRI